MQIIPSILVQTEQEFLEQINAIDDILPMIQLDIADGKFVPNKTWADPEVMEKSLMIDCELHLMVQDPLEEARKWEHVPQVKRVLVHFESDPENIANIVAQIQSYGWEVGVVLNPDTDIEVVDDFIEEIDAVMLMGVVPGKQGQLFISETNDKAKAIKKKYPNMFLSLDGGVNEETLPDIIAAGFDAVCPGSAVFGNDFTPRENIEKMKGIINKIEKI